MNFGDRLYSMWMDCGRQEETHITMPCGHEVNRQILSLTGGICPSCIQREDDKELGLWPDDEPVIGSEEFWCKENGY